MEKALKGDANNARWL